VFFAERDARRIVLLSCRAFLSRKTWASATGLVLETIKKIQALEKVRATVHYLEIDLSIGDTSTLLSDKLDLLFLPPVVGVVHTAGIIEDELVLSTT
jgi:6-methylsalicylic acid synthase